MISRLDNRSAPGEPLPAEPPDANDSQVSVTGLPLPHL